MWKFYKTIQLSRHILSMTNSMQKRRDYNIQKSELHELYFTSSHMYLHICLSSQTPAYMEATIHTMPGKCQALNEGDLVSNFLLVMETHW